MAGAAREIFFAPHGTWHKRQRIPERREAPKKNYGGVNGAPHISNTPKVGRVNPPRNFFYFRGFLVR